MNKPRIIVFASGTKQDGGSGFENLVAAAKNGILDADITGVVSNHETGGVAERAKRLGVPFMYFPGPYDAEHYRTLVSASGAEWVVFSGWFKKAAGLDPRKTINIHPTLFSHGHRFRGAGMYGSRIHDAVAEAHGKGEVTESGFTMHFVTEEVDGGPVIIERPVPLTPGMTAADIERVVKEAEFEWQPKIINAVVHGKISWDGKDPVSLITTYE